MRVKVKRDFMSNELGDFQAGFVYEVKDGIAAYWISAGLVEPAEKLGVLLQSKPHIPQIETKPDPTIKKRRIKKNEDHHAADL
jgi:hypothetical protein